MKRLLGPIIVLLIGACGGGGYGGSSGSDSDDGYQSGGTGATQDASDTPEPTELAGKVIDGYISGATVCLDLNNNLTCDADEPSAESGEGGAYTFTYEGTIPAGTQILADVPVGAVDEDLGPVQKPYNMLAPSENPDVVTPLTTLVSQEILSSGSTLTPSEAELAVKSSLGFSDDVSLLDSDFIESEDTNLQTVATVVAEAFATAKETLANDEAAAGLTAAEIAKAAVIAVKENVGTLVANGGALVSADEVGTSIGTVISGQVQNIVASTKAGDGTVVNLVEELKNGDFIILSEGDDVALDENDNGVWDKTIELQDYYDSLLMEFFFFPELVEDTFQDRLNDSDLNLAMLVEQEGALPAWIRVFQEEDLDYTLVGDEWVAESAIEGAGQKVSGNCVEFLWGAEAPDQSYCFVRKDLSGKTIGDVVPDICDDGEIPGCDPDAVLPEGAYVYDATFTVSANDNGGSYTLYSPDSYPGYVDAGGDQSVAGFIEEHTDFKVSYVGDECNVAFRVKSYTEASATGVMEWVDATRDDVCGGAFSFDNATGKVETTKFDIETFGDTEILKVKTPLVYQANNTGDTTPYLIFSAASDADGVVGVFYGDFVPSGTRISLPFTGDTEFGVFASRVFVDFALESTGLPAFPYDTFLE